MRFPILNTIKSALHDLVYIWKRELKNTFSDQGVLIFFIVVPLAYPLLYSFMYTNEVLRETPTVVVDESRSSLSREYLRKVDATPDVAIVSYCADMEEAKEHLRKREAYGIIFIPADFEHNIIAGQQSRVSIFCDMSGLLYYKAIYMANSSVSLSMNSDIKVVRSAAGTVREGEIASAPIAYDDVPMFNPTAGFAAFLIPAVLILIIQQTLLLGIGMLAGTARERDKYKELVPLNRRYNGTLRIILGKSLCYMLLYMIIAVYVLCVVPRIFSLNQIGQFSDIVLFVLPYLLSCIFFSMAISVFIVNREMCILIFVFTSVPLLFISGISWPSSAIPQFWEWLSYIFPSTFGINGFVRINNMGATLNEVSFEYKALWVQTGIYFIATFFAYRWQIMRSRQRTIAEYEKRKALREALRKKTLSTNF